MTAEAMLEIWGLRVAGGRFTNPSKPATHQPASAEEDELAVVHYVCSLSGFRWAEPVLRHRHVLQKPVRDFQVRQPGESLEDAIERLGWWMLYDLRAERMPGSVYWGFYRKLELSLEKRPFVPPSKRQKALADPSLEGPVTPSEKAQFEEMSG